MKWEMIESLDVPCADISYRWISEQNHRLIVTMHFSRVIGGFPNDVELTFYSPIALQWADEKYGTVENPVLEMCSNGQTAYPSLIIPNSDWADLYAAFDHTEEEFKNHKVTHYAFVALNDVLDVLSVEEPSVAVIEPREG